MAQQTISYPPEFGADCPDVLTQPIWNEKVFGIVNKSYTVKTVRFIGALADVFRIQIGPRNMAPVLDTIYDDVIEAGPVDVLRVINRTLSGTEEVVVRIALTGGQGPNDTGLIAAFLVIED